MTLAQVCFNNTALSLTKWSFFFVCFTRFSSNRHLACNKKYKTKQKLQLSYSSKQNERLNLFVSDSLQLFLFIGLTARASDCFQKSLNRSTITDVIDRYLFHLFKKLVGKIRKLKLLFLFLVSR